MEPNTIKNTPRHCHECHKFSACEQAQFMVAGTEAEDAYYLADSAELTCADCAPKGSECVGDSGDTDSPSHCSCGTPLRCSLTPAGIDYVVETLNDDGGCCRELWPVIWDDYLEYDEETNTYSKR